MVGLVAGEKRAIKKKEVVKLADQLRKLIPSNEVIDQICGEVENGLHLSLFRTRTPLEAFLYCAEFPMCCAGARCFQDILGYSLRVQIWQGQLHVYK